MKRLFQRVLLLFLVPFLWVSSSWGQANVVGQWTTLPYQMPINPVHGILLNTGKVLIVSGSGWVAGTITTWLRSGIRLPARSFSKA